MCEPVYRSGHLILGNCSALIAQRYTPHLPGLCRVHYQTSTYPSQYPQLVTWRASRLLEQLVSTVRSRSRSLPKESPVSQAVMEPDAALVRQSIASLCKLCIQLFNQLRELLGSLDYKFADHCRKLHSKTSLEDSGSGTETPERIKAAEYLLTTGCERHHMYTRNWHN